MDFKSLIGKLDSIEAPEKTPKAPTLPKSAQLNEDAQMRVLAGQTTVLAEAELMEKAVSKSQQKAAGAALAAKRGDGKAVGASKDMMKMSTKELEKIAGTKHKGLPEKKDESVKEGAIDDLLDKQKADKDSDDSGRRKHSGSRYGGSAQKDDEDKSEVKKDRKTAKESVELDIEEFNDKFSTMVEAAKKAPAKKAAVKKTDAKGAMNNMFGGGAKDLTKNLTVKKKDEKVAEGAKPDFLDLDGDGDRKEPMKKAAADKKKGAVGKKDVVKEERTEIYAEKLAKQVFDMNPNLSTSGRADELISAGMKLSARDMGAKRASSWFNYDEDFSSDFVSAYAYLQDSQGQQESVIAKKMDEGKSAAQKAAQEKFKAMVGKKKGDAKEEKTDEGKMMPKDKKKPVKESIERKLTFKQMMNLVVESGGQQQIDPTDQALFAWAQRVAETKLGEGMKAEVYAGLVYERMGGRFEMYDVLSENKK
jgi:hypothetical protein